MSCSWKVYLGAAIVLAISFLLAWALPTTEFLRGFLIIPGVAALVTALLQILRDNWAHERALALQREEQVFNLSAASHMANVAFDKHVDFSEKYISKMQEALSKLFQKGPTKEALGLSDELIEIRLRFRAWITKDLQSKLLPFEGAFRKIGALQIGLEGVPPGSKRSQKIDEVYAVFSDVLGLQRDGVVDETIAVARIMDHLQELLGVEELTRLRGAVIKRAISALESGIGDGVSANPPEAGH